MPAIISSTLTSNARDFLSSLGVNTHSSAASGAYASSVLVSRSLAYLGINTVRDNFVADGMGGALIEALAQTGVKFDFLTPSSLPSTGSAGLANYVSGLAGFETKYGAVRTVEGLNEANIQKFTASSDWAPEAVAFQQALYNGVKGNAALAGTPVVNMSIGLESSTDYAKVGDLSAYSDFANAHAYASTLGNIDSAMEQSIGRAGNASTGHATIVTETGYTTYTPYADLGVSELGQAKLTLTALLDSWENGAKQTFLYELIDSNLNYQAAEKEYHFGLFNADGTPKLAATAVHNLTTILSFGAVDGAMTTAGYSIGSAPSDGHATALSKGNGVYDLLLWRDAPVWDPVNKQDLSPASADMLIDLGKLQEAVYVYDPLKGTTPVAVYHGVSQIVVPVGGNPLVVEIGASSPVVETTPSLDPNLVMTADYLVSNINALASAAGNSTITLTGDTVLKVATVATMQDMISHYAGVLGRIQGDYSFQVTTTGSYWRKDENFDSTGKSLSITATAYNGGLVTSKGTAYADGSHMDSAYSGGRLASSILTAADGSTLTSAYDTSTGQVLRATSRKNNGDVIAKSFAGGALQQTVESHADNSRLTTTYDTNGAVTSTADLDSSGTWTTASYDPATGAILKKYIKRADSSSESYVSGITGQSYAAIRQATNANGVVTLIERYHADGSLDYRQVTNADGSKLTINCDAQGGKLTETSVGTDGTVKTGYFDPATKALLRSVTTSPTGDRTTVSYSGTAVSTYELITADGTRRLTTFNITGKSYTKESVRFDPSGQLVLLERFHADGTLDFRQVANSDGSKTVLTFDTAGHKISEARTTALGTVATGYFDPATGALIRSTTRYTTGRIVVNQYSMGVVSSSQDIGADGSSKSITFDSQGRRTGFTELTSTGDHITTVLDSGTGAVLKSYMQHKDGSAENFITGITGQSYAEIHQVVNAAGVTTLVERWHADQTWEYRETLSGDGTRVMLNYDSAGRETAANKILADGTTVSETFDAASGQLTGAVVKKPDGTRLTAGFASGVLSSIEEVRLDKSKVIENYDANGHVTKQVVISASGDWTTSYFNTSADALSKAYVQHADGSSENFITGITGQAYAIQRQVADSSGKTTLVERWYADGTRASTDNIASDGSRDIKYYNTSGLFVSETFVSASGSMQTVTQNGTVQGAALNLSYGVAPTGVADFGAAHDLLDMSRLDAGASPTIALQAAIQSTTDPLLLAASAATASA